MLGRTRERWRRIHSWSSLVCTAFLFVLALTGLPLIFREEIDGVLAPPPRTQPSSAVNLTLDEVVSRALSREPGKFVSFLFWDEGDPRLVGLGMSDVREGGLADVTRVLLDARTATPLSQRPAEGSATDVLSDLHRNLCAGPVGDLLLALVSLAFLLSVISGVVVYWPLMERVGFAVLRRVRGARILSLDAHNLLSMVWLPWTLVVAATGFMNTLEAPLFAAWDSATMPAILAPYQGKPPPAQRSSIDAAVATAKRALPNMRPTSVGFPESPFGSPRHYLIWMHGDSTFSSRMFQTVLVDAESGALTLARPFPWYLKLLELSRPLHFGDYGGLALKLVWVVADLALIVVLATGLYLWSRRAWAHEASE